MATIDLLTRTTTFSKLDRERLVELDATATTNTYRRGEVLWRAGDVLPNLVIVQKGLVKLVRPTTRGRAICGLFGPAEAVDDLSLVRGVPCPTDAVAASDSVVVACIPRSARTRATA